MTATLKRGLSLTVLAIVVGVVGCTTEAPFILSLTGLPPSMTLGDTATLTATGGPGSSAGLWTWTFTSSCGGTLTPSTIGPTNSTTVTTVFNSTGATPGPPPCTITAKLTTASGRTATRTASTTIIAVAQVCSSGNINVPIPDHNAPGDPLNHTISCAFPDTITDVDVRIRINHTWDADLDIFVIHPDGTEVELSTDNGWGANYGSGPTDCTGTFTTFDDEAATPITAGTPPFAGSFRPEGLLSTLDGKLKSGTWTLRVDDDLGWDTGTLFCWEVVFN